MTRLLPLFGAACLAAETPGPALVAPAADDGRPSVLLITLDTTRADHLGPYGGSVETPTIDALAVEGTTFERAYATCPLTIPSHASMLTGLTPPSHGVRDNGDYVLSDDAVTLAERLRAEGWTTAAFTSAFPTQARWGLDQGFAIYHDALRRLPTQLDWSDQRRADEVVDDAIQTLEGRGGPMFGWVHLFDPHWPYEAPEPYASAYADDPYGGEIAWTDHEVGRLLDWWEARYPNSLIIVTADHGEGLGDGGEETHGFLLHDATVRVPLIVRGPGFEAGARIDDPVSHIDLVPTVLEVLGLDPHHGLQGADLREGGSDLIYSEALTAQYHLGLAPLVSLTDASGRVTGGAWTGHYEMGADGVSVEPHRIDDETDITRLAALQASLEVVQGDTTALDAESLRMLMELGYMGGDITAEAGDIDPRDVIDVIPLTWKARQLIGARKLDNAAVLVDHLNEQMPGAFGVDQLQAEWLHRAGRLEDAVAMYGDLFLRSPSSTLALQLAGLAESRGDWAEALGWFEEAAELQPGSPEAMAGVVKATRRLGDHEEAQALAGLFLLEYPDHAELSLVRAELLLAEGRATEALVEARAGGRGMPHSPWAHAVLGRALWETGQPDPAIEHLLESLRIDPWSTPTRARLSDCLLEVGRTAEAVRLLRPMANLRPQDAVVQERFAAAVLAFRAQGGRMP